MLQRTDSQQKIKRMRGSSGVVRTGVAGTLGGFLLKKQQTLITTPWQVLQITPTNVPGEFKVWVLVSPLIKFSFAKCEVDVF